MGKMITAILAIALIAGGAYYALEHAKASDPTAGEPSSAKKQLDNVRQAGSRMESDADQRARDLEGKMQDGQ